jgi:SatD family (SatD)
MPRFSTMKTEPKQAQPKNYVVITCDIMRSRQIEGFQYKRDQKLRRISELHVGSKLILSEYAITAWDEFEAIVSKPVNLPAVILDLRRQFHPFELWIGIGIGKVTGPYRTPVNKFAGGEAFERAREAVNSLKAKPNKAGVLTSFVSGIEMFDLIANTIYHLHDTLLRSVSIKQWKTINAQIIANRQDLTAKRLRLNESTVSRSLRRGFWWQIKETQQTMERVIGSYFQ